MTGPCVPCALEEAEPTHVVFRNPLWAGEIFPGFEVPGWLVVRARRHVLHLRDLDEPEAHSYGAVLRDLSAALCETLGVTTVYTVSFGERHRHFHTLVIARGDEVPAEHRSANIFGLRETLIDVPAAEATARAVAARLRHLNP
ncbi:hypothetical protein [Mycolicibacterium sp.]|uniref:hypothetical protein n=1 Tax=Mycolicibacterium sp. TaxID=2320850 RepID=UPI003D1472E1